MNKERLQSGVSLIELLVALALGAFLILGITQIYIGNRGSYIFQQGQSENQEGARYAMMVLQQEVGKAGFRRRPDQPFTEAFPAITVAVAGCTFAAGQTVDWDATTGSLCIRYEPMTDQDRDCLGNTLTGVPTAPYEDTDVAFIERFYVTADSLMCATATGAGELMAGIADLRFEFGLADPDFRAVDEYVAPSGADETIAAVRYAALLRSSMPNLRVDSGNSAVITQWSALAGLGSAETTALQTADDRHIYQIAQGAVMLRNLLQ